MSTLTTEDKYRKQPRVFQFATVTSLLERHGYYIISFLITLIAKNVFNYSDVQAFALFALFTALSYVTTVVGGYISDNYIGIKRCMGLGLIVEMIGYFILAYPSGNQYLFQSGLAFIILGSGLFKTCPTNLMARSYEDNDPRIDGGFTLYYMGINIGSFISSFTGGLYKMYGWNFPFLLAGIGMAVSVVWFFYFRHTGDECEVEKGREHFSALAYIPILIFTIISVILCVYLLNHFSLANFILYAVNVIIVIYFIYEIIVKPKEDKKAILTCLILIAMALIFFVLYYQAYTSFELYIERCVNRTVLGFEIPTVWFISLNPIWIFILSPILAKLYRFLGERKKDPAITTKFPLGILLVALGFFVLSISTYTITANGKTSGAWFILVFLLYSAGELLTSALGFSMVAKISPKYLYGMMTGAWYIITASLAAVLSGLLANFASVPDHLTGNMPQMMAIYNSAFFKMGAIAAVTAIIGFIISPWLKKLANLEE